MKYKKRTNNFSQRTNLKKPYSLLLKYIGYTQSKRYKHFYSEEAAERETIETLEESSEILVEALEEIESLIEEVEKESPKELEAKKAEVLKEIEGEVDYSKYFNTLRRLRLYNVSVQDLVEIRRLALGLAPQMLESLLKASQKGEIPEEVEKETGLTKFLKKIKNFFKGFRDFILNLVAIIAMKLPSLAVRLFVSRFLIRIDKNIFQWLMVHNMKWAHNVPTFILIFFISLAALVLIPGEREVKTNPEEVKNETLQEDGDTIIQLKSALSEAKKILPQNENEEIDYETFQEYAKGKQELIEKLNKKLMKKINKKEYKAKKEYKDKIEGEFRERIKKRKIQK